MKKPNFIQVHVFGFDKGFVKAHLHDRGEDDNGKTAFSHTVHEGN